MKTKLLFLVAVFGCATSGLAGVLFWTVNTGATTKDVDGNTPSTQVQSNYNNWDYASLVHYSDAVTYTQGGGTTSTGTALSFSPHDDKTKSATQIGKLDLGSAAPLGTEIANPGTYSSGVFYIELFNENNQLVGRSKDYLKWDGDTLVSNDNNAVSFEESFSDFTYNDLHAWNGGATYVAVPEPTSGVMLLLGAALLGLRRRRA